MADLAETVIALRLAIPERKQRQWKANGVYIICDPKHGLYKIGKSRFPLRRFLELQGAYPYELKMVHAIESDKISWLERVFHERFAHLCLQHEWFQLPPFIVEAITRIRRWDVADGTELPIPWSEEEKQWLLEVNLPETVEDLLRLCAEQGVRPEDALVMFPDEPAANPSAW